MGRLPDVERRTELLDAVVAYLAEHGLADVSLRPMARSLGVSVNALVHHFGSKSDLVVAALRRAVDVQAEVRDRWVARNPGLSQAELLRRWWRWINVLAVEPGPRAPRHRGRRARRHRDRAARPGPGGPDRAVAGEHRAAADRRGGAEAVAADEASLVKAMFTGLVVDLLATGERRRLARALEVGLARLDQVIATEGRRPQGAAAG